MAKAALTRYVAVVPVRTVGTALGVASGMRDSGHGAVAVLIKGQPAVFVGCQPNEVKP